MKVHVEPEDIHTRKADNQGRISLPATQYKNKTVEIAVLDVKQEQDAGGKRK